VIITQPASQIVPCGPVTFSVTAAGSQPLTYQWRFNSATIPGAVGPTYSISDVETNDTGRYDVVVANSYGSVRSAAATLTVQPFSISGRVFDIGGTNPLAGVSVKGAGNPGVSDANGYYQVTCVAAGDYSMFASLSGYNFGAARQVTVGPDITNLNFTASNR